MPLPTPNLDDRDFDELLAECKAIAAAHKQWTDFSPSDPGTVLLELFAHLTEVMIYRLNRIPEKAFVEFLRLLGVKLSPASAASVTLHFTLARPQPQPLEIPRGTRVTVGRTTGGGEQPVFLTVKAVAIAPGETAVDVTGCHCELVEGELVGKGTGLPGLSVKVKRPPIIAPAEGMMDLVVGIEAAPEELEERAPALPFNGKSFRIWQEKEDFVELDGDSCVYVADRMMGTITFAPALRLRKAGPQVEAQAEPLAAVPKAGREIRVWYCRGGGASGNLAANQLQLLKEPISGVSVTNPEPAKGGMDAETISNALARGPLELHSLHRAVTARDFETIARREAGIVARAKAFTKAALWKYAAPGTVEVLLVPSVPSEARIGGRIDAAKLAAQQTEAARQRIVKVLDERRPLGTICLVDWVRYKTVKVRARIVIRLEEDPVAVRARVLQKLNLIINPLPTPDADLEGWRFGQSLWISQVYDIILAEPGVKYVEQARLLVEEAPDKQVGAVVADIFQPQTWYAGSAGTLFRSVNNGGGWELLASFPNEEIKIIKSHPAKPGVLLLVTQVNDQASSHCVRFSEDCGESWTIAARTAFTIDDAAWLLHRDAPVAMLAADTGLYELALKPPGTAPRQILVNSDKQDLGFYAVTVADIDGGNWVAVAARGSQGVYLSDQEGRTGTFQPFGLNGENVRVLEAQKAGSRHFIWAGVASPDFELGKGCLRRELRTADRDWTGFDQNWKGGSCLALAFAGDQVLAATHHAGVLGLDSSKEAAAATWSAPDVKSKLPMRDVEKFQLVSAVAANPDGSVLLAGGPEGVFRSLDHGVQYDSVSGSEPSDQVPLPDTWLFCSGEHEITIVNEHE